MVIRNLPDEYVSGADDSDPVHVLLLGGVGVGKTTFAIKLPEHLIVQTEPGIRKKPRRSVKVESWEEFTQVVDLLSKAPEGKYQWVCVDTLDRLVDMATEFVCKSNGWTMEQFVAHGGGYNKVASLVRAQALKLFAGTKSNVLWTSHTKTKKEGDKDITTASIYPTTFKALNEMVALSCLIGLRAAGRGKIVRSMYFGTTNNMVGMELKDRIGGFPDTIDTFDVDDDSDVQEFLKHINGMKEVEQTENEEENGNDTDALASLRAKLAARQAAQTK